MWAAILLSDVNVLLSPATTQRAAWWAGRHALRHRLTTSASARFLLVCTIAFCVVVLLVGPGVLAHSGRAAVGLNPASDFQIMTWSLEWWPWALGHGVDPLHTSLLWAPSGFSTLWMTTIPTPALLAAPLTLVAGPLVSYNVLMLLAIPLAAGAAYLLCLELSGSFLASLMGGLLFGLSPYMLGHMPSQHLNLLSVRETDRNEVDTTPTQRCRNSYPGTKAQWCRASTRWKSQADQT